MAPCRTLVRADLCYSLCLRRLWLRSSGMVAPVLAEVLYERGPVWPLAVFCLTMLLVAIFAGEFLVGRAAALRFSCFFFGAAAATVVGVVAVVDGVASMNRHNLVRSNPPPVFCLFALFRVVVKLVLLMQSFIPHFAGLLLVRRTRAHLEGSLAVFL